MVRVRGVLQLNLQQLHFHNDAYFYSAKVLLQRPVPEMARQGVRFTFDPNRLRTVTNNYDFTMRLDVPFNMQIDQSRWNITNDNAQQFVSDTLKNFYGEMFGTVILQKQAIVAPSNKTIEPATDEDIVYSNYSPEIIAQIRQGQQGNLEINTQREKDYNLFFEEDNVPEKQAFVTKIKTMTRKLFIVQEENDVSSQRHISRDI